MDDVRPIKKLRFPKTPLHCKKRGCDVACEYVVSSPDYKVWVRMHCGCGDFDEHGYLHEDDVLLLLGTMAIKSHNRKDGL
jgi:hypothetical protein